MPVEPFTAKNGDSLEASEGFLAENHPVAPTVATSDSLSPFARKLLNKDPRVVVAHARSLHATQATEAIHPDSDRSEDEEPLSSDDGFIDDTPIEFDGFAPGDDDDDN